jgi:signal transduction histidine kinase
MQEKNLLVEIQVDPAADRAFFDSVRFGQVLVNLLNNAIRFSPVGGKILVGSRKAGGDNPEFVEIYVADSGPGVATSQRERIFKPYVRLAGKSQGSGLGLGLAICQRVVDAHGGSITVQDEPAGGSRFTFTLPVSREYIDVDEEKRKNG